jgi:hypothetical protein
MPSIAGLPFSLAVIAGVVLLAGTLVAILLATFTELGAYSLLALLLPAMVYTACLAIGKKYGEFYAYNMSRKPAHAVKTGAWISHIYEELLIKKMSKNG